MPTLSWIGKDKVLNHHNEVPYRILEKKYSYGDDQNGNMVIHGDNLEALKSLLPEYEGKVKCIYIDPPYNTGNEGWVYNDNVNDPRIKKWLGDVVGKEGDDLSRHDKWLCMMYPRLRLLQKLLSEDGAIFISIDDNESANLRLVCDEIFGKSNYQGCIVRSTGQTTGQDSTGLGSSFDYVFVYSRKPDYEFGGLPLTAHDLKRFKDKDEKGYYAYDQLRKTGSQDTREDRPNMYYPVEAPDGTKVYPIAPAGYEGRWRMEEATYRKAEAEGLVLWKKTKRDDHMIWWPYIKYYAEGRTKRPSPLWTEIEGNKKASRDVRAIFATNDVFDFPKPIEMIERIISIANVKSGDVILDSFAGSGTTAHAVLNANKADGGSRRFILVEMEDYADSITAERVRRVINGYGEGSKAVEGAGGGFSFYELGEKLFADSENLNPDVPIEEIRKYIWFMETRSDYTPCTDEEPYLLGTHNDMAYYFIYEKESTTALNKQFLSEIRTKADGYVIYADTCLIPEDIRVKYNITFKKIPRDITRL